MSTYSAKAADIQKKWVMIDAEGLVVGRLAFGLTEGGDGQSIEGNQPGPGPDGATAPTA